MGKTLIQVECLDQKLTALSAPTIASGGRNEDVVEFSFCPLWDGFAKTAVFYREKKNAYHVLITDDRCIIPHEVLAHEGMVYFGVFGVKGETVRTTEVLRYRVKAGVLTDSTKPSDPTPDVYTQIMAELDKLSEEIVDLNGEIAKQRSREITIEGFTKHAEMAYVDVTQSAVKNEGYFATGSIGGTLGQVASAAYTFITLEVSAGEVIRATGCSSQYVTSVFLTTANGVIVAKYPELHESNLIEYYTVDIVIPDGVTAVCVNQIVHNEMLYYAKIEKAEESYKLIYTPESDALYGKKLACVGDSITEATKPDGGYFKNYAELVATRHNMTVYKDGKGGSTMANTEGHNPFCVSRYLNVPSDFDILTIWFGWNDASYSTIGTIEDTEDTTFYGAYKKVLEHFITTYPTKKIGLIVPYGNASVEPFRVAVRALSEMYGVPCLDLVDGKQCSLLWGTANVAQEARRAALTYDSTHPNQAGHEYLSTMYEEFIKRL